MKVTERTLRALTVKRIRRDFIERGYEEVGERGGKLWELYRGARIGHRVVDVEIDPDGMSLWVKIEREDGHGH